MPFTKQEMTILCLLAKGKNPAQLKDQLGISINTYNAHRQSINRKLKGTGLTIEKLTGLSPEFLESWIKEKEQQEH